MDNVKTFWGIAFFCFLWLRPVVAQEEVVFVGNQKTKASWLRTVLQVDMVDSTRWDELMRLSNTGLFQEVSRQVLSDRTIYRVVEKDYMVPIFFVAGLNQRPIKMILGVSHYNLMGRAIQATAYYQYFQHSSGEVNINASRLFKGRHGPYLYLKHHNTREPIFYNDKRYEYNYGLRAVELGYTYYIRPTLHVTVGVSHFREIYRAEEPFDEETSGLPSDFSPNKVAIKGTIEYNRLTNYYHLQNGYKIAASAERTDNRNGDFAGQEDFEKAVLEAKYFNTFHQKWNWAMRLKLGVSSFDDTPFSAFVKDDLANIRGIGDRVARGSSEITWNAEIRRDLIIKNKIFSQGVVFADYSNILPGNFFDDENTTRFADFNDYRLGLGLRVGTYYFYNSVLRLDASFDPTRGTFEGFVLGVGQFF